MMLLYIEPITTDRYSHLSWLYKEHYV
uniref:Uncharacterized protein n=1 Tax=Arundo donax TaxID=35708 RepID=A0A0A8ZHF0_ARUDO